MSGIVLKRAWHRRPLNRPWSTSPAGGVVTGPSGDPDAIYIAIRGDTTEKSDSVADYFTAASRQRAIEKILDYYGKIDSSTGLINSIEQQKMGYYFSGRPKTRVVLLYSVPFSHVKSLECKGLFDPTLPVRSSEYSVSTFGDKIDDLAELFKGFQDQYKFFPGRVSPPLSFTRYYNRLRLAYEKIVEFIEINGIEYRTNEDDTIQINFDSNYKITNIIVTQNGLEKHLIRANKFYFEGTGALTNSVTNKMLHDLAGIYSTRNDGNSWTHFVELYIDNVNIEFTGLSQTPKAAELIANAEEDINKLFMSMETADAGEQALQNVANQMQMINDAASVEERNMAADLEKVAKKLSEAEEKINLVREYINLFGINHLIEAAIECLTLKTGVPIDSSFLGIPLPGISPWEKPKPPVVLKIPKMYPVKLPKIDIGQALADEILKGLKSAGMQAIVGMMQTLAEIILEACTEQDRGQIGNSPPLPSIINDYPSPDQAFKDDPTYGSGAQGGMLACLSDYGILEPDANEFFIRLSNSVSPQEICDALNGAPSVAFLEVVYNLNISTPSTVRDAFIYTSPTGQNYLKRDVVIDFFVCIGKLVSPDFCVAAYAPTIVTFSENVDVCALEDMLVERVNAETLDQLAVAYQNIDDVKLEPPNMNPGCGIVPALTDMPALNHSITSLYNTVFETPKTSFVQDIQGLQTIMLVPSSEASAAKLELVEKLEEHLEDMKHPTRTNEDDSTGETFMKDLFGDGMNTILSGVPGFDQAKAAATNALETSVSAMRGSINYDINPAYKANMSDIESRTHTTYQPAGSGGDINEANEKAYFWVVGSTSKFYYAPFSTAAGSLSPHGIDILPLNSSQLASVGGMALDMAFRGTARTTGGSTPFAYYLYDSVLSAMQFDPGHYPSSAVHDTLIRGLKKLWFPANLSTINLLGAQIGTSRLFDVEEFEKLIMVPKPCQDGGTSGDLSGFDDIIKQAKQDFEDNASSCQDERPCTLGPVEDSLIFALVSAYLQIMILEQVTKNIWLIDAYGFNEFVTNPDVVKMITDSIKSALPPPEATMTGDNSLNLVYAAAVLHVNKLRQRYDIEFPGQRLLPDPQSDPASGATITIDPAIVTAFESPEGSYKFLLDAHGPNQVWAGPGWTDTSLRAGNYALEYMIKLRLGQMGDAIGEVFEHDTANLYERYLLHGIPELDVIDASLNPLLMSPTILDLFPQFVGQLGGEVAGAPYDPMVVNIAPNTAAFYSSAGGTSLWNYDGIDSDDVADVISNGALVLEKYVKFDFDLGYYQMLAASAHEVDQVIYQQIRSAVEKLIGRSDSIGFGIHTMATPANNNPLFRNYVTPGATVPTAWLPADGAGKLAGGKITLTVTQEQFNEFYGLFARPHVAGSLTRTLENLESGLLTEVEAATNQEILDINAALDLRTNVELTYLFQWYQNMNWVYTHDPGLSEKRRGVMKGPLNEQNYEAVRYWFNEVQGDMNNPRILTITSGYYNVGDNLTFPGYWYASGAPRRDAALATIGMPPAILRGSDDSIILNDFGVEGIDDLSREPPYVRVRSDYGLVLPQGSTAYALERADNVHMGRAIGIYGPRTQESYGSGYTGQGSIAAYASSFNDRIGVFYKASDMSTSDVPEAYMIFIPYFSNAQYPPAGATLDPDIWSYQNAQARPGFTLRHHLLNQDLYWANCGYPSMYENKTARRVRRGLGEGSGTAHARPERRESSAKGGAGLLYYIDENGNQIPITSGRSDKHQIYRDIARALGDPWDIIDTTHSAGNGPNPTSTGESPHDVIGDGIPTGAADDTSPTILASAEPGIPGPLNGEVTHLSISEPSLFMDWKNDAGENQEGIFSRLTLSEYQAEMQQFQDALQTQLTILANLSANMVASDLLTSLATNIRTGARVAYYSPELTMDQNDPLWAVLAGAGQHLGHLRDQSGTSYGQRHSQAQNFFKDRSGYIVQTKNGYVFNTHVGIVEEKVILPDLTMDSFDAPQPLEGYMRQDSNGNVINTAPDIQSLARFENYMQNIFEAYKKDLCSAMSHKQSTQELWGSIISIKDMVALLFLYGINLSNELQLDQGPEHDFRRLFTDTKGALRTGLGATFNSGNYCYQDPNNKSESQKAQEQVLGLAMAGAQPFVQMGASFVLKMLIQTPLRILKGLAEVADPHVIVGKIIKDQTGHVIKQVEPYWPGAQFPLPCPPDNAPEWTYTLTNDINNTLGDVFEPTFVDFLNTQMGETFGDIHKALRPEVSNDGVNLIGKLPYLFALPPFIFGIIYILLDLFNKDMLTLNDINISTPLCPGEQELVTRRIGPPGSPTTIQCIKPPEPPPRATEPCEPPDDTEKTANCQPDRGPTTTCDD